MIRINLLPHREAARKRKKDAFNAMLLLTALVAVALAALVWGYYTGKIAFQEGRNSFLQAENARLDKKIEEVATLKQEIEALRQRKQAVEDLQGDRNLPVHLLNEMVVQTPDGVYVTSMRQNAQAVVINGVAQSQSRVAELLANLDGQSQWIVKPQLIDIKAKVEKVSDKISRDVFDFSISITLNKPSDLQKKQEEMAKQAKKEEL